MEWHALTTLSTARKRRAMDCSVWRVWGVGLGGWDW